MKIKKVKDMGPKELTIFIILIVAISFIFGLILGAIIIHEEAQEDLIKINEGAQDCFIRFQDDFQGFKTCVWHETHDLGFAKIG